MPYFDRRVVDREHTRWKRIGLSVRRASQTHLNPLCENGFGVTLCDFDRTWTVAWWVLRSRSRQFKGFFALRSILSGRTGPDGASGARTGQRDAWVAVCVVRSGLFGGLRGYDFSLELRNGALL